MTLDSLPIVRRIVTFRYPILCMVVVFVAIRGASHGRGDWPPFAAASQALFGRDGLHVLARHQSLYLGPFGLLAIRVFVALDGYWAMVIAGLVAVLLLLRWLEEVATRTLPGCDVGLPVLIGGALVGATWVDLLLYGHIEDAIVLALGVGAIGSAIERRPLLLGVCLGLAIGTKQWAVILVPLVLALERRERVRALVWVVVITCAAWTPFLLADFNTVNPAQKLVALDSVPHMFGLSGTAPPWWSASQIVVATAAAALVARRRPEAVLLVAVAMRIALDPSTWDYYAAGLVLGAFVFDLLATRWRIPWTTLVAFVFVAESHELITTDSLRAWTRAVAVLAICAVVLAIKMMGRRTDADVVALPDGHNQW